MNRMNFELLIADYDGFLVDSKTWRDAFYFMLCQKYQKPCPGRSAYIMSDGIPREMDEEYNMLGFDWEKDKEIIWDEFKEYARTNPTPIFMATLSAMQKTRARERKVALVTLNSIDVISPFIARNDLESIFCSIMTREDGNDKAELFLRTAEKLRVHSSRCSCIGDHILDIKAAKRAGMFPLAVGYGGFTKAEILLKEIPKEQIGMTPEDVWPTIARYL